MNILVLNGSPRINGKLLKKFLKQKNKVNIYDNQAKNMAF